MVSKFNAFKRNKDGGLRTTKGGQLVWKKGAGALHKRERKSVFRKSDRGKNNAINSIANSKNKILTSVRKSKTPKGYKINYTEVRPKAKIPASKGVKTRRKPKTKPKGIFHPYSDLF